MIKYKINDVDQISNVQVTRRITLAVRNLNKIKHPKL